MDQLRAQCLPVEVRLIICAGAGGHRDNMSLSYDIILEIKLLIYDRMRR